MKAIDMGNTVAIDIGNKLVQNSAKILVTSKSQVVNAMVPSEEITKKVNEVIDKFVETRTIHLNKLIDGSRVNHPNSCNAIAIQYLVSHINGSCLK